MTRIYAFDYNKLFENQQLYFWSKKSIVYYLVVAPQ